MTAALYAIKAGTDRTSDDFTGAPQAERATEYPQRLPEGLRLQER